jgi:hypothetical protein
MLNQGRLSSSRSQAIRTKYVSISRLTLIRSSISFFSFLTPQLCFCQQKKHLFNNFILFFNRTISFILTSNQPETICSKLFTVGLLISFLRTNVYPWKTEHDPDLITIITTTPLPKKPSMSPLLFLNIFIF